MVRDNFAAEDDRPANAALKMDGKQKGNLKIKFRWQKCAKIPPEERKSRKWKRIEDRSHIEIDGRTDDRGFVIAGAESQCAESLFQVLLSWPPVLK